MDFETTLEEASAEQLVNRLAEVSEQLVVAALVEAPSGGGVVISKWGRNAIVAAGLLRQLSVEVDAALLRQSQEAEDEPED